MHAHSHVEVEGPNGVAVVEPAAKPVVEPMARPSAASLGPERLCAFLAELVERMVGRGADAPVAGAVAAADLHAYAARLGLGPDETSRAAAEFLGLEFVADVLPENIRFGALPRRFCLTHQVVPLESGSGRAVFVLANPFDWQTVETVLRTLDPRADGEVELRVASPATIETAVGRDTMLSDVSIEELEEQARLHLDLAEELFDAEIDESSAPVVQLVTRILDDACSIGATDVHIQPVEREIIVRYRVDGTLRTVARLESPALGRAIAARVKVMSRLDIAERRLPQDGRISFGHFSRNGHQADLRVGIAPMTFGESVVIRVLDRSTPLMALSDLGMTEEHRRSYRELTQAPHGMILHVGPTGSGKSSTLYAAMHEILTPEIKIVTAEDPVEYSIPGIDQLQVNPEIGLTFHRALRSFLRLDPDVILVGEIRDSETARMAVEASLTGHLLFSTLHTNDAATTIIRLMELGVDPVMVSSSILGVCAQRLLRRLCTHCREPYEPGEHERSIAGIAPGTELIFYRRVGCDRCGWTGVRGRIGVHELIRPNSELRTLMKDPGLTAQALKRHAIEETGMTPLFVDALNKVRAGICSLEEVLLRVPHDDLDRLAMEVEA